MKHLVIALHALLVAATISTAAEQPALTTENDRINYAVGFQVAGDLKRQGVNLQPEIVLQGMRDALVETGEPRMSTEEMHKTLAALKKKIDESQLRQQASARDEILEEGQRFLAENANKEEVVTLPSGLQYRVLKEGGGPNPGNSDTVTISYKGTLINGREFDSSAKGRGPVTVAMADLFLPGWREALPLMREGARWQLFLPPQLAFGEQGPLADKVVIYEVELLSVTPANK